MRFRAAPLALLFATAACTSWRPQTAPAPQVVTANANGTVRVTRHDQSVLVLRHPQVVGDSIVGDAGNPPRRAAIAMADVDRIDARKVSAAKTGGLSLGVIVVGTILLIGAATAAVLSGWN
jgi:CubicO group peptidase (beta-lactamase class C family)